MAIDVEKVEGEIDYDKVIKEFGVEPIEALKPKLKKLEEISLLYRRGIIFAHRDLNKILDAIEKKENFAVLTGFNPSAPLHFGNKMFIDQAIAFQRLGGKVYIPLSDDETYVFGKSNSLEEARERAYSLIPKILALGLDVNKTKVFVSSTCKYVYPLAVKLSRKTTLSTIKAIFGFNDSDNPGKFFYGVVQAAHILLPQIEELEGRVPTVVPIGIDQDPYIRLARDLAEKLNFEKPSSTNHFFMRGLRGGKMSGSKKESAIFLDDSLEIVKEKIMNALTGGAPSREEQRKFGGKPERCVVFEYFKFHLVEDDERLRKIYSECREGERVCGDCKQECFEMLAKFLESYRERVEKAKDMVGKVLLE